MVAEREALQAAVSYFFFARFSLIRVSDCAPIIRPPRSICRESSGWGTCPFSPGASSFGTAFDTVQLRHVTGQGGFDGASAGANMLIHMQVRDF